LASAAVLGVLLLSQPATAKIWRVDNNPGNPGDFTTAQLAQTGAAAGDTLYFTGSGISYGNLTLTKKLIIFGPGYFLTHNPETQANPSPAILGNVYFNAGSSGSLMTGMQTGPVELNTSNLVFKRNFSSTSSGRALFIAANLSNLLILQNYLYTSDYWGYAIYGNGGGTNILIRNNYLEQSVAGRYATEIYSAIDFSNNVIYGIPYMNNSVFYNNILRNGAIGGSNNAYSNNIGNSTQFGTSNGNQQNVVMTTVFQGGTSADGQWQLKAGSPAIGAGQGGTDIGMFGGTDAYVLSGMPAIPAIWFFNGPATGSGPAGLPIQVKVKSHN
jgi:hypothetical protein